ncbi:unnamed protein product [Parajaminaea phylloscopi]
MAPARYAATIGNLAVSKSTKCIVQGLGKASTFHSQLSLKLGTNIVGGVSPGKGGKTHLDLPVFDSIKEANRHLRPHATAVFVPPLSAADAILDAIENEIPLIVSVAEGIPLHDQLKIMSALHSQSKSRLVGANSPGILNPSGCRLGISPVIVAAPGPVGIASRSGTLSYEAAASSKHLGQSLILGLGGDFYPGTRTVEALDYFMADDATKGIILVGEVGGVMEEEVADAVRDRYLSSPTSSASSASASSSSPLKPIVGFIAGRNVPPGSVFGHSGAIWRDGLNSAEHKRRAWSSVGIRVVDTVVDTGPAIEEEMRSRGLID